MVFRQTKLELWGTCKGIPHFFWIYGTKNVDHQSLQGHINRLVSLQLSVNTLIYAREAAASYRLANLKLVCLREVRHKVVHKLHHETLSSSSLWSLWIVQYTHPAKTCTPIHISSDHFEWSPILRIRWNLGILRGPVNTSDTQTHTEHNKGRSTFYTLRHCLKERVAGLQIKAALQQQMA